MNLKNCVYITVITNKKYLPGVFVLNESLKDVNSKYKLTALLPHNNKDEEPIKEALAKWNIPVLEAEDLDVTHMLSGDNKDHYWGETFFKLRAVGLEQFDKIVLLDSDMVVLKNIDHLFTKLHMTACAAGRCITPEWVQLNSGTLVIKPDKSLEDKLISCIPATIKRREAQGYGVGDQDVFHELYPDWPEKKELHLSEGYNALRRICGTLCREYIKGGYDDGLYIVHFIGVKKPWEYTPSHIAKILYRGVCQKNFAEFKSYLKYRSYLLKLE